MGKKRVYEFAKEMHVDNKDVIDIAKNLGIEVKNHMSSIDQDQEAKIKGMLSKQSAGKAPSSQAAKTPAKAAKASSAAHKEAAKKPVAAVFCKRGLKKSQSLPVPSQTIMLMLLSIRKKTQNLLLSKKTSRRGQIRPLTAKSS